MGTGCLQKFDIGRGYIAIVLPTKIVLQFGGNIDAQNANGWCVVQRCVLCHRLLGTSDYGQLKSRIQT